MTARSFRPMASVMSFSRAPNFPFAPVSMPPWPGSMTMVLNLTDGPPGDGPGCGRRFPSRSRRGGDGRRRFDRSGPEVDGELEGILPDRGPKGECFRAQIDGERVSLVALGPPHRSDESARKSGLPDAECQGRRECDLEGPRPLLEGVGQGNGRREGHPARAAEVADRDDQDGGPARAGFRTGKRLGRTDGGQEKEEAQKGRHPSSFHVLSPFPSLKNGGGGNRTRVRRHSTEAIYTHIPFFILVPRTPKRKEARRTSPAEISLPGSRTEPARYPAGLRSPGAAGVNPGNGCLFY